MPTSSRNTYVYPFTRGLRIGVFRRFLECVNEFIVLIEIENVLQCVGGCDCCSSSVLLMLDYTHIRRSPTLGPPLHWSVLFIFMLYFWNLILYWHKLVCRTQHHVAKSNSGMRLHGEQTVLLWIENGTSELENVTLEFSLGAADQYWSAHTCGVSIYVHMSTGTFRPTLPASNSNATVVVLRIL